MQQLPQGRKALSGLLTQPLPHLGLAGELLHPKDFARQRIVAECLTVRQTAPT